MLALTGLVHAGRGGHAGLHPGISVRARRQEPRTGISSPSCPARWAKPAAGWRTRSWAAPSCCCWPRCVGVPIGFLGGVYLAEFGGTTFSYIVRYVTDLLNGVPSIVMGIFALHPDRAPAKTFFDAGRRPGSGRDDDPDCDPQFGGVSASGAAWRCARAPWRWARPNRKPSDRGDSRRQERASSPESC